MTILTRKQVDEIEAKLQYDPYVLLGMMIGGEPMPNEAGADAAALCATVQELREVLELCCCAESEQCAEDCRSCEIARRIKEAQE